MYVCIEGERDCFWRSRDAEYVGMKGKEGKGLERELYGGCKKKQMIYSHFTRLHHNAKQASKCTSAVFNTTKRWWAAILPKTTPCVSMYLERAITQKSSGRICSEGYLASVPEHPSTSRRLLSHGQWETCIDAVNLHEPTSCEIYRWFMGCTRCVLLILYRFRRGVNPRRIPIRSKSCNDSNVKRNILCKLCLFFSTLG